MSVPRICTLRACAFRRAWESRQTEIRIHLRALGIYRINYGEKNEHFYFKNEKYCIFIEKKNVLI